MIALTEGQFIFLDFIATFILLGIVTSRQKHISS